MFSTDRQPRRDGSADELAFLAEAAAASTRLASEAAGRTYRLLADSRVPLVTMPDRQWIFAGQFLWAPPGSRIDVEVQVIARGDPAADGEAATVWLMHDLFADVGAVYSRGAELRAGERAAYRYSLGAGDGLERIENRLWVLRFTGRDVALDVERATMTITPLEALESPVAAGILHDDFAIALVDG